METPKEFNLAQFKELVARALRVSESISKLFTSTDANNFEISDDNLIAAFKPNQIFIALSQSNAEIGTHMDNYEKLTQTGEVRLMLFVAYDQSKTLRNTLNNLYEVMRDLDSVEKIQVRHSVLTIRTFNETLHQKLTDFLSRF